MKDIIVQSFNIEGEIITYICIYRRYFNFNSILTPFWTASLKVSRDYGAQFFTFGDEIILSTQLSNKYLACVINMIA